MLQDLLKQAISQGLTKKLACLVAHGQKKFEFHAGSSTPETEYDLASLTKIFCTTLLAAKAVSEKKLKLDEQPWPNWPGVTVEHILAHTAGLFPWAEIEGMADVLAIKPVEKPGVKIVYSDMGFIALGALLEKRLGAKLEELFKKPGMHFRGLEPVDDPRCRILGGVAGHAGLFGTLEGVYEESKFFLKCLKNPETPLEYVLKSFAEYPGPRGLGFDKPSLNGSAGGVMSEKTIGHLGYTGTSVWIDPVQDTIYILLMRRLDAGSRAEELMTFRRQFHQQAASLVSSS
jgi:CubicO group peptidase (beta-lactamase class C family)